MSPRRRRSEKTGVWGKGERKEERQERRTRFISFFGCSFSRAFSFLLSLLVHSFFPSLPFSLSLSLSLSLLSSISHIMCKCKIFFPLLPFSPPTLITAPLFFFFICRQEWLQAWITWRRRWSCKPPQTSLTREDGEEKQSDMSAGEQRSDMNARGKRHTRNKGGTTGVREREEEERAASHPTPRK